MNTKLRFASLFAGLAILVAACGGGGATPAPSEPAPASQPPGETAAPSESAAGGLEGSLTVWHSYGSGGGEGQALDEAVALIQAENPGLQLQILDIPFNDLFNKYQTDVAAGGGPDLYIAPNDSLFSQADAQLLLELDGKIDLNNVTEVAVEGSKVNGKVYMVPESLKAVALWYDKSSLASAPTTTDELLAGVQDGSIKLGINQNAYHNFGFYGAFGGQIMDADGKCVADQGGVADALKYLADLKAAGAQFYTDGNQLKDAFQTGQLNATIDGPWQTADFRNALGENLAVAPMPAGPNGTPASPMTGVDGWYINPNSANVDLAIGFAQRMTQSDVEQIFVDKAGHVPVYADDSVTITDPITIGFKDAAFAGFPRPQRAELNNYWGPFGDAINKVLDTGADPTAAAAEACQLMNEANGK